MIVDVKIYYCVDNHFPPRRNEIPTEEQFERNWKALPDWVWENGTSRMLIADNGHGFLLDCGNQRYIDAIKKLMEANLVKKVDGI
ncbi:MAG: hypothetical protein ACPGTU_19755, partial [Myxococcota bacterium]